MATQQVPCIHGLERNLDFNSGFYGTTELNRERIFNAGRIEIPGQFPTLHPQPRDPRRIGYSPGWSVLTDAQPVGVD